MDPLSTPASLIALISAVGVVLHYARSIKRASKEQEQLAIELDHLESLLITLRQRFEHADPTKPWFDQIKVLGAPGALIDQMNDSIQHLRSKICPSNSTATLSKKAKAKLTWSIKKKDIDDALKVIDRFMSNLDLALEDDHFKLSLGIKNDTSKATDVATRVLDKMEEQQSLAAIDWLKAPDSSQNHHRARSKYQKASGKWLLKDARFLKWQETPSCLWLCGNAGSGKTILSSIVIEQLSANSENDENIL